MVRNVKKRVRITYNLTFGIGDVEKRGKRTVSVGGVSRGNAPGISILPVSGTSPALEMEPEQVIVGSELMRLEFYQKSAEQYIHNRGKRARVVKKWLALCEPAGPVKRNRGLLSFLRR